MEYHQDQLQKHCRICGNRLSKTKGRPQPVYSCADYTDDLVTFVGLGSGDAVEDLTLPPHYCNVCFMRLRHLKKARLSGTPSHPIIAMEWTPHTENCKVRGKGNPHTKTKIIVYPLNPAAWLSSILLLYNQYLKKKKKGHSQLNSPENPLKSNNLKIVFLTAHLSGIIST